jgi:hypothetical protein
MATERFIVRADEKPSAFLELQRATHPAVATLYFCASSSWSGITANMLSPFAEKIP